MDTKHRAVSFCLGREAAATQDTTDWFGDVDCDIAEAPEAGERDTYGDRV